VKEIYPRIREQGGEVLAVSFSPPARVSAFLRQYPLPFAAVSDPERQAYRAMSLERTTWKAMLRPGTIWRFVKLTCRGWLPKKPAKGDDVFQLGGDFVLDERRNVIYAYRSAEPTDRPKAGDLLNAIASM
jgi:hypothetical protein